MVPAPVGGPDRRFRDRPETPPLPGQRSPRKLPVSSTYLHGTHRREQRRLSLLNSLLNEASLRELGLRGGEKILEMGSGLGQFAQEMARAASPGGTVIGIERSRAQMSEVLRRSRREGFTGRVEFRRGDAVAPPLRPREWGTFDVAHARFLLEHVPAPGDIVRRMVRAVRPGGRVVLEDDDHDTLRLHPEPAGFAALWRAYIRTFERLGNDPYVGRRLVTLLREGGARPVRITSLFYGGCAGRPPFDGIVENIVRLLEGARGALREAELLDARSLDRAVASLRAWGRRRDAALWYSIPWAEGVRPA